MYPPPSNAHHCLTIVDVNFNTERPIKPQRDEALRLKSTMSSQRLQGTLLAHVMATID